MEPIIEREHRETVGKRVTHDWWGAGANRGAQRGSSSSSIIWNCTRGRYLYDKQFFRKTVALGPIEKIARNAGATTRV
jgi:hypothetical protein